MSHLHKFLLTICLSGVSSNLVLAQSGNINLLPEFGKVKKSRGLLKMDKEFLDLTDKNFPNRQAAAAYFAAKGWTFIRSDDYITAIKRFNQAWLLDSTNASAYWGFGAVTGVRRQYETSLQYLRKSYQLDPANKRILLAVAHTLLIKYDDQKQAIDLENSLATAQTFLSESHDAQANTEAYMQMARIYFFKQDYPTAWKYADLAVALSPGATQKWDLLDELNKIAPR